MSQQEVTLAQSRDILTLQFIAIQAVDIEIVRSSDISFLNPREGFA